MKIVHITSAHPALDIRIFFKECVTLFKAGHEVHLIVPLSTITHYEGVIIHPLNLTKTTSRWRRLFNIYALAKSISADIYHFHDPEFIPFALLLKISGKKIIYDVHEDTPLESLSFNKGKPIAAYFKYTRWVALESLAKLLFDGFICATPHITKNFPIKKSVTVRNLVNVDEFNPLERISPFRERSNIALYVGGIMHIRGVSEMVQAIHTLRDEYNPQLKLIGKFFPEKLQQEVVAQGGSKKITHVDWLDRKALIPHFFSAKVGLVLLHPEKNFIDALPIKLFEYMAAGLPVVASDFPLWREIVIKAKCGFVVNPLDISAIKKAMTYIFDNPDEAERMGSAGRHAVEQLYNWEFEAKVLREFYQQFERR
ncbi:MAG: glycosyltransferase family 4 protein [Gammaproteobacteria bacterium]|nr:glycosyltransferase family 4 protein [Gammaproteobacteria bacterium]